MDSLRSYYSHPFLFFFCLIEFHFLEGYNNYNLRTSLVISVSHSLPFFHFSPAILCKQWIANLQPHNDLLTIRLVVFLLSQIGRLRL